MTSGHQEVTCTIQAQLGNVMVGNFSPPVDPGHDQTIDSCDLFLIQGTKCFTSLNSELATDAFTSVYLESRHSFAGAPPNVVAL
ncbi:hypothetical protein RRG08_011233 [Elysia crispata]|uniref:Uncharacterized protein n=1 Tax=Elysia crispata TaxID=231223 RepID=A0AAE0YNB2_9GAST|nr:hypothetical protein RRG08_011233 [Elysia crispata]